MISLSDFDLIVQDVMKNEKDSRGQSFRVSSKRHGV
jgi:hypothetical protein